MYKTRAKKTTEIIIKNTPWCTHSFLLTISNVCKQRQQWWRRRRQQRRQRWRCFAFRLKSVHQKSLLYNNYKCVHNFHRISALVYLPHRVPFSLIHWNRIAFGGCVLYYSANCVYFCSALLTFKVSTTLWVCCVCVCLFLFLSTVCFLGFLCWIWKWTQHKKKKITREKKSHYICTKIVLQHILFIICIEAAMFRLQFNERVRICKHTIKTDFAVQNPKYSRVFATDTQSKRGFSAKPRAFALSIHVLFFHLCYSVFFYGLRIHLRARDSWRKFITLMAFLNAQFPFDRKKQTRDGKARQLDTEAEAATARKTIYSPLKLV